MEVLSDQTKFISIFSSLEDPRADTEHRLHHLKDIVCIAICAVNCRCDTWDEVAEFGEIKKDWFRKFLDLPNGIPSHDTFRRVFMILNPKHFNECFAEWTSHLSKEVGTDIVPIDGKTICGSKDNSLGKTAIHMVSAWSSQNGIVLSQEKLSEKSNEISAIPELLKTIDVSGSVVTIDAMGCQKDIASQIVRQKGDYVLALKQNHLGLHQRVEEVFKKGIETNFKKMNYDYFETNDVGHGRVEQRNYFLLREVDFLKSSSDWKGLKSFGMVETFVNRDNKVTQEKKYYITSLNSTAERFGECVRTHWQVENNLHWVLDLNFNDDGDYKRAKNSAANFSMVKRLALNVLKKDVSKGTMRTKRLRAALNEKYLENLIFGVNPLKPL